MTNLWTIKDADGNVTNECIKGTEEFVAATFDHYEAFVEPSRLVLSAAESARMWRDGELRGTDYTVPLTDHPQHAAYITYRAALRSWPADEANFPDTKPTLGE